MIQKDPSIKSYIVTGLTRSAKSGNTSTLLEDQGQLKISETNRRLLEQLDKPE